MLRRSFFGLGVGAVLAGCAPVPRVPAVGRRVRAVAFDLFTIFDPRGVDAVAERLVPGRGTELCDAWRTRQFEYTWIRAAAGQYRDFHAITGDALVHAAASRAIVLSHVARAELVSAYETLPPWPDSVAALTRLREAGLRLVPLANYTPVMLENLLTHAGLRGHFEALLSTDQVRTFKPDPRAYDLGPRALGLPRSAIAFSAFGGWDAAGARWFGHPTFWVNRLGRAREELAPGAHATGSTLTELAAWVLSDPTP